MSLLELGPAAWALIVVAFIAGGMVKGVIGMGMPLVVVPSIASFIDPLTGIVMVSVSVITANIWQIRQGGHFAATVRRFWTLIIVMMPVIAGASFILVRLDETIAATTMGVIVILFTLSRAFPITRVAGPEAERWLSPAVGAITGLITGMTGLISPPLTMYLVALRLPKDEFITAIALMLLCGASPLYANLAFHGVMTTEVMIAATLAIVPAWAGVALGGQLRQRISQRTFQTILLTALFLIGLNLLRRGLF